MEDLSAGLIPSRAAAGSSLAAGRFFSPRGPGEEGCTMSDNFHDEVLAEDEGFPVYSDEEGE